MIDKTNLPENIYHKANEKLILVETLNGYEIDTVRRRFLKKAYIERFGLYLR